MSPAAWSMTTVGENAAAAELVGGTRRGEAGLARLGDLALRYVAERTLRGEFRGNTPTSVRGILVSFARSAGWDLPPSRLRQRHVERWLERGGQAPSTVRTRLSVVRRFLAWLVEIGQLRSNPAQGVRGPRRPRQVPRGLRRDQISKLLQACPDARARLIVLLMCQEGLRCREVAAIEVGDIDGDDRLVLVRGKGDRQRVLPISDESWRSLVAYLEEYPATAGPLVRSYNRPTAGLTPTYVSERVSAWLSAAGVKVAARDGRSAHALRHTAATDMLRAGAHVRDVQHALGHSELSTTQRYLPWLVGDLRKAMGGRSYTREPNAEPPANHDLERRLAIYEAAFDMETRKSPPPGGRAGGSDDVDDGEDEIA